jgi:hypothetical protein
MSGMKNILIAVSIAIVFSWSGVFLARGIRETPPWLRSAIRLRDIGLAILSYHGEHGKLPAVVHGKDGKPLYSWRVLLLSFLARDRNNFKLDEPWDSDHNKAFLDAEGSYPWTPDGNDPTGTTRYQVLIGPGTAFEHPGLTFKDFPDGLENTILVVEASEPVPWSKPVDLIYEPNGPLRKMKCESPKRSRILWRETVQPGFNAVFADGQTRFIPSDTDEKLLRALITRNGGENLTRADLP